uniref:C3H1-type domain-containing protein n=1 Tax=Timema tahoe TaxID=61484 RepID=A0A7R9NW78_9NEOP|nr:unnamed protein product [Timema tahoe]
MFRGAAATMDTPKKNNDCYFYYYSSCLKVNSSSICSVLRHSWIPVSWAPLSEPGDGCMFRHEPSALGCETMCSFWQQGKCLNTHCNFRHMELRKNRKMIPCYWENQPTGCRKQHCPFLHKSPREAPASPADHDRSKDLVVESGSYEESMGNTDLDTTRLGPRRVSQGGEAGYGSPPVDPLVVNFEEEVDTSMLVVLSYQLKVVTSMLVASSYPLEVVMSKLVALSYKLEVDTSMLVALSYPLEVVMIKLVVASHHLKVVTSKLVVLNYQLEVDTSMLVASSYPLEVNGVYTKLPGYQSAIFHIVPLHCTSRISYQSAIFHIPLHCQESDTESAPTSTPTKLTAVVKTLEQIRLERVQAEQAALYNYESEDSSDLRARLRRLLAPRLTELAPMYMDRQNNLNIDHIVVKTLQQIRAEKVIGTSDSPEKSPSRKRPHSPVMFSTSTESKQNHKVLKTSIDVLLAGENTQIDTDTNSVSIATQPIRLRRHRGVPTALPRSRPVRLRRNMVRLANESSEHNADSSNDNSVVSSSNDMVSIFSDTSNNTMVDTSNDNTVESSDVMDQEVGMRLESPAYEKHSNDTQVCSSTVGKDLFHSSLAANGRKTEHRRETLEEDELLSGIYEPDLMEEDILQDIDELLKD